MRFIRLFVALASLFFMDVSKAERLLIDDFRLDQEGISTDQFADYDTIEFDSPLGKYRELWGGGASVDGNCLNTQMSASVSDGTLNVMTGTDCYGGGCVRWGGNEVVDISAYNSVVINVAQVVGSINIRLAIAPNLLAHRRLDAILDRTGEFRFDFEDFNLGHGNVDLSQIGMLNICMSVEQGEFIALDSVHLAVPEPQSVSLVVVALISALGWRSSVYRYQRRIHRPTQVT